MNLKYIRCKDGNCIQLVQDSVQWRTFVNFLLIFLVPKETGKLLKLQGCDQFFKKDPVP